MLQSNYNFQRNTLFHTGQTRSYALHWNLTFGLEHLFDSCLYPLKLEGKTSYSWCLFRTYSFKAYLAKQKAGKRRCFRSKDNSWQSTWSTTLKTKKLNRKFLSLTNNLAPKKWQQQRRTCMKPEPIFFGQGLPVLPRAGSGFYYINQKPESVWAWFLG
jgi:hypothetical protein